ncbi:hypothetical protein AB672_00710 [Xylella taiwanensis]|nr:hypothetical protein AB672_00710 [Xylella taiwanensis]
MTDNKIMDIHHPARLTDIRAHMDGLYSPTHTHSSNHGCAHVDLKHPDYLATKRKVLFQDQNKTQILANAPLARDGKNSRYQLSRCLQQARQIT